MPDEHTDVDEDGSIVLLVDDMILKYFVVQSTRGKDGRRHGGSQCNSRRGEELSWVGFADNGSTAGTVFLSQLAQLGQSIMLPISAQK